MTAPRRQADLTQGPIFGHVLRMSIPMMIGMTAHMLVNIVDGIYAGRLGTQESLAVLNYGFPFFYLFFAILNGIGSGLSSTLARAIGAKRQALAENTLTQAIWFCVGAFALFQVLYPWILPAYLRLQGASPEAAAMTRQYLNMLYLGMPFTIIATMLGSSLRAEGNTRTLMNAMMVGTLVNVLGAPFIIYHDFTVAGFTFQGLGLSVVGAGLSTSASAMLSCLLIASHYWRGKAQLKPKLKPDFSQASGFKDSLRVALPSMLSQALIGLNLGIMTHLAKPFGDAAVAAVGIASRLDIMSVFPALSIMVAVVSLVGQNFGAGKMDRVRESVRVGLLTAFISLSAIGLAVFLFRSQLIGFFKPDAATYPSALHFLSILTLGYGFVGMGIVASGAFQGLGRGLPYLGITFMRLVLISAPAAFLLSRFLGEKGLHYGPTLAAICTGITASAWAYRTVAKLKHAAPTGAPAGLPAAV